MAKSKPAPGFIPDSFSLRRRQKFSREAKPRALAACHGNGVGHGHGKYVLLLSVANTVEGGFLKIGRKHLCSKNGHYGHWNINQRLSALIDEDSVDDVAHHPGRERCTSCNHGREEESDKVGRERGSPIFARWASQQHIRRRQLLSPHARYSSRPRRLAGLTIEAGKRQPGTGGVVSQFLVASLSEPATTAS